jgi:hypothetical protein
MPWYHDADGEIELDRMRAVSSFLIERDGKMDTPHFLEKPWHYEKEWIEYKKSIGDTVEEEK